jgi:G3E family GTPase
MCGVTKNLWMFEQNLVNHYETTTIFRRDSNKFLPVTLVTGPLGSGKTSMIRHVLKSRANLKICVAINDFTDVNVDEKTLACCAEENEHDEHSHKHARGSVVALKRGDCGCCSPADDSFRESISRIIHSDAGFDYAVVETSGITDPVGVIAALEERFGKMYRARLDLVVAVIDASLFFFDADGESATCSSSALDATTVSQLKSADLVVINKIDLIDDAQV